MSVQESHSSTVSSLQLLSDDQICLLIPVGLANPTYWDKTSLLLLLYSSRLFNLFHSMFGLFMLLEQLILICSECCLILLEWIVLYLCLLVGIVQDV